MTELKQAKKPQTREAIAFILANPSMLLEELAAHFGCTVYKLTNKLSYWRKRCYIPKSFNKYSCRRTHNGTINRERKLATQKLGSKPNKRYSRAKETARQKRAWGDLAVALIVANQNLTNDELALKLDAKPGTLRRQISKMRTEGLLAKDFRLRDNRVKVHQNFTPRFTTSTKKIETKFQTLANRDAGKVLVKVDARTWKYLTPEKAADYLKTA